MQVVATADGSNTLHSERYGETYHSINGAVTEAQHVFLTASGVMDRLARTESTRVLEIGFGLGLNCLLTADAALQAGAALDYHAIEQTLDPLQQLEELSYAACLKNASLASELRNHISAQCVAKLCVAEHSLADHRPVEHRVADHRTADCHRVEHRIADTSLVEHRLADSCIADATTGNTSTPGRLLIELARQVSLTLHIGDATRISLPEGHFDAVYLDAFSPDVNPECWTADFLAQLKTHMAPGAKLTTYSAKGVVRRALLQSGFVVNKLAGPPGKREMLQAIA